MVAAFRTWLFPVKSTPSPVANVSALNPAPVPLNPAELSKREWMRLSDMIDAGMTTAGAVQRLQSSSSDRIDAAGYALEGLRAELAAAMTIPKVVAIAVADATATNTVNTVHMLEREPRRERAKDQALAA